MTDNAQQAENELHAEFLFNAQLLHTAKLLQQAPDSISDDLMDYLADALDISRDLLDAAQGGLDFTDCIAQITITTDRNLDAFAPELRDLIQYLTEGD